MIKVKFRTNLDDVMRYEKFPDFLPAVPNIGDRVASAHTWPKYKINIELEVCMVTWKNNPSNNEYYAEIELHLPKFPFKCISEFEIWYQKTRGVISEEYYRIQYQELQKRQSRYS